MLNMKGEVTGIAVSTLVNSTGIGFVIPSSTINKVVATKSPDGIFKHPWLGIESRGDVFCNCKFDCIYKNQKQFCWQCYSRKPSAKAGIRRRQSDDGYSYVRTAVVIGGDVNYQK